MQPFCFDFLFSCKRRRAHAFHHPRSQDSFIKEASGGGLPLIGLYPYFAKSCTDSGNCGIFQKIPPAGMTGGCGAGMTKEAGSGAELLCTVYLLLATCYLLLATCYLLLATCYLLLATCYLLLATCYLLLATCYLLLATCYLLLATCYLLLATCYLLLATCYLLLATCYLLLATCYLLLATCYLLLATCYLLLATCYLPHPCGTTLSMAPQVAVPSWGTSTLTSSPTLARKKVMDASKMR